MLDQDYRPIGEPDAEPAPPPYPGRVRSFVFGMGLVAQKAETGEDPQGRRRAPGAGSRARRG